MKNDSALHSKGTKLVELEVTNTIYTRSGLINDWSSFMGILLAAAQSIIFRSVLCLVWSFAITRLKFLLIFWTMGPVIVFCTG